MTLKKILEYRREPGRFTSETDLTATVANLSAIPVFEASLRGLLNLKTKGRAGGFRHQVRLGKTAAGVRRQIDLCDAPMADGIEGKRTDPVRPTQLQDHFSLGIKRQALLVPEAALKDATTILRLSGLGEVSASSFETLAGLARELGLPAFCWAPLEDGSAGADTSKMAAAAKLWQAWNSARQQVAGISMGESARNFLTVDCEGPPGPLKVFGQVEMVDSQRAVATVGYWTGGASNDELKRIAQLLRCAEAAGVAEALKVPLSNASTRAGRPWAAGVPRNWLLGYSGSQIGVKTIALDDPIAAIIAMAQLVIAFAQHADQPVAA